MEELRKSLRHRQKIIKLADKSEAGWLEVKEYQREELASDSEDEKRIKKAQERALKNKKQNAFKRGEKSRNCSSASSARSGDERMLFLVFQHGRQVLSLCLSCSLCLLVMDQHFGKGKYFPSYERSEGEEKCVFLQKLARADMFSC